MSKDKDAKTGNEHPVLGPTRHKNINQTQTRLSRKQTCHVFMQLFFFSIGRVFHD